MRRQVEGVRVVLTDGAAHSVDSNEMAFKQAARGGFRQVSQFVNSWTTLMGKIGSK